MASLDGIKVLDLTRLMPGPFCTMLLADMGADVLHVEQPDSVEGRRAQQAGEAGTNGPMVTIAADSPYAALYRNKKSLVLNLKMKEGQEIFGRLASRADVLVEEMRPGTSRRLGIDFETLQKMNPRLIYCSISGYGQNGPWREKAGHDINYLALAGALGLIGERGGKPSIPLNIIGDIAGGGLHAVIGILLALLARPKTGRGQYVDISVTDSVISMLTPFFAEYFANGKVPERGHHAVTGKYPYYQVYETKDGRYISIGCLEPWFYANLCRALKREDLISQMTAPDARQDEIHRILTEIFLQKTRDEWDKQLRDFDLCAGKVLRLDEVAKEPHFADRRMFIDLEHPERGIIKQVGIAIKLSDTPGTVRGFSPRRGEHTDEVLEQLGYSKDSVARFREAGCVS